MILNNTGEQYQVKVTKTSNKNNRANITFYTSYRPKRYGVAGADIREIWLLKLKVSEMPVQEIKSRSTTELS